MTGLHRFACVTSAFAFILLIAGAMVTSTGSSLAVPDWPLAFGQYFPKMTGGVLFEHGHRMIAGTVAIMTLVLTIWVWLVDTRGWVRALASCALVGIVIQAALGGITVLYSLPRHMHQVSIAHAVLGQTVFCLILSVAQVTSHWYLHEARASGTIPVAILWISVVILLIYAQLVLGALVRHTGANPLSHALMALVVAGGVLSIAIHTTIQRAGEKALTHPSSLLMALVPLQLVLGIGALLIRFGSKTPTALFEAGFRSLHLACGAAILGTCVVLGWRLWRTS